MAREYDPAVEVKSSGLEPAPDVYKRFISLVLENAQEIMEAVAAQKEEQAEHGAGRADV